MPLTYNVEIKTEWKDSASAGCPFPDKCGGVTIGTVEVTMNWVEGKGYFGTNQNGVGEYLSWDNHYTDSDGRQMLGHVASDSSFDFSASLSMSGSGNSDIIKAGFSFLGEGDVTLNWDNGETLPFWGMMGQIHGWFSGKNIIADLEFDTSGFIDPNTFEFDHDLGMLILELPLESGEILKEFSWITANGITLVMAITLTPVN